jgi:hypothetical protein
MTKLGQISQTWDWGIDTSRATEGKIAAAVIQAPFGDYYFTRGWGCSISQITPELLMAVVDYMNYYGFTSSSGDTVWDIYQQARCDRIQLSRSIHNDRLINPIPISADHLIAC